MKIKVKVKPCSSRNDFIQLENGEYLATITERAEKGKANVALVKLIAKRFRVLPDRVVIKNKKSREKVVEILDN